MDRTCWLLSIRPQRFDGFHDHAVQRTCIDQHLYFFNFPISDFKSRRNGHRRRATAQLQIVPYICERTLDNPSLVLNCVVYQVIITGEELADDSSTPSGFHAVFDMHTVISKKCILRLVQNQAIDEIGLGDGDHIFTIHIQTPFDSVNNFLRQMLYEHATIHENILSIQVARGITSHHHDH